MDVQNEDFNDAMFDLNDAPRPAAISISTDSNLPDSISGYGVDINNEEANAQYIEENRPREIIQAASSRNGRVDTGLGSSISKTRSSEFIPEIIEIREPSSSDSTTMGLEENILQSESNHESSQIIEKSDESKSDEHGKEEFVSAFDLALSKEYREQAKIYYDDIMEKGLPLQTEHVKPLKDVVPENKLNNVKEQFKRDNKNAEHELEEPYFTGNFAIQKAKMLQIDFQKYLELLHDNQFKKVLQIMNKKRELNDPEKQIKRNIKSKDTRSALKNQTIELIRDEIEKYESIIKQIEKTVVSRKQQCYEISVKLLSNENLNQEKRESILKRVRELEKQLKIEERNDFASSSKIIEPSS